MIVAAIGSNAELAVIHQKYPGVVLEHTQAIRLERTVRRVGIHAVLVASPQPTSDDLLGLSVLAGFPSVPIVFCDPLVHHAAAIDGNLAEAENPILCLRARGARSALVDFVERHSPLRDQIEYRRGLKRFLAQLPARTRAAIEIGLSEYPVAGAVKMAAHRAGYSVRQFRTQVTDCGIADPGLLFWGRRTIDACAYAKEPAFQPVDIARKSGCARYETLAKSFERLGVQSLRELAVMSGHRIVSEVLSLVIVSGA